MYNWEDLIDELVDAGSDAATGSGSIPDFSDFALEDSVGEAVETDELVDNEVLFGSSTTEEVADQAATTTDTASVADESIAVDTASTTAESVAETEEDDWRWLKNAETGNWQQWRESSLWDYGDSVQVPGSDAEYGSWGGAENGWFYPEEDLSTAEQFTDAIAPEEPVEPVIDDTEVTEADTSSVETVDSSSTTDSTSSSTSDESL